MYVTAAQLADRPGATELTDVATPERQPIVDAGLMEATLRATDRSAWSADDVAVADAALAVVNAAITDAGSLVDGYLAKRYSLPFANPPTILTVWARAIARYLLHKDRRALESNDPIVRDYSDALKLLAQVAAGTISLGADDPTPQGMDVQFTSDPAVFGRNQTRNFR